MDNIDLLLQQQAETRALLDAEAEELNTVVKWLTCKNGIFLLKFIYKICEYNSLELDNISLGKRVVWGQLRKYLTKELRGEIEE